MELWSGVVEVCCRKEGYLLILRPPDRRLTYRQLTVLRLGQLVTSGPQLLSFGFRVYFLSVIKYTCDYPHAVHVYHALMYTSTVHVCYRATPKFSLSFGLNIVIR
jgi:hypothetical protein